MRLAANAEAVVQLADQCVMCGLCLPHCPTYVLAQDEAESPRGRIALAKAVATGTIPVSESVLKHLDQCLGCLACETACPSNVQYENLLVQTRALIEPARQRRRAAGGRLGAVGHGDLRAAVGRHAAAAHCRAMRDTPMRP